MTSGDSHKPVAPWDFAAPLGLRVMRWIWGEIQKDIAMAAFSQLAELWEALCACAENILISAAVISIITAHGNR